MLAAAACLAPPAASAHDPRPAYATSVVGGSVATFGGGTVTPIDLATNTAGTPITVGTSPEGLAITPDGKTAWVTDTGSGVDTITPLDLASGNARTATHVGQAPMTIAITPDRSPTAAFGASTDELNAQLDASASSDPDGSVARYAWDFGDGQGTTTAQPIVAHAYAQPGAYTVTLTVTDDEGCSRAVVFTGQTASCTGSPDARVTHTVTVAMPPAGAAATPAATQTPAMHSQPRQAIERFTLEHRCVRRGRDGRARSACACDSPCPDRSRSRCTAHWPASTPRPVPRGTPARATAASCAGSRRSGASRFRRWPPPCRRA
jgi:hypothetical protein